MAKSLKNAKLLAKAVTSDEEKIYIASQWQLVRWRFKKHKLAVVSLIVLVICYLIYHYFGDKILQWYKSLF